MKSVFKTEAILARQKWAVFVSTLFMSFALMSTNASAAHLDQVGKNAGGQGINLLLIFTVILGAITITLGILAWTTNIPWLAQAGTKKMLVGAGGLVGALTLVMVINWIFHTVAGAGGSLTMQWPF